MADNLFIARTPEEAASAFGQGSAYLAGGTEALRLDSPVTAGNYVSVRRTPALREVGAGSGIVRIGASCTFQELAENDLVPGYLKEALRFMGSRTKRNMATIGGNIASCRDDSYLIPTLIAAGAGLELIDSAGNVLPVAVQAYVSDKSKFTGMLITAVTVPSDGISVKSSRNANTVQSHARLTAALSLKDGRYTAVCALKNSGIFILDNIAEAMGSRKLSEDEIVELVKNEAGIELEDDLLYGGADYRIYLLGITLAMMYRDLSGKGGLA